MEASRTLSYNSSSLNVYLVCIGNGQQGHSADQRVALLLCSLQAATSQFSIAIGQKMQLTGWHNANDVLMRYAWTHKLQLCGPTVHSLYCHPVEKWKFLLRNFECSIKLIACNQLILLIIYFCR